MGFAGGDPRGSGHWRAAPYPSPGYKFAMRPADTPPTSGRDAHNFPKPGAPDGATRSSCNRLLPVAVSVPSSFRASHTSHLRVQASGLTRAQGALLALEMKMLTSRLVSPVMAC